jgi:hypothetical protein
MKKFFLIATIVFAAFTANAQKKTTTTKKSQYKNHDTQIYKEALSKLPKIGDNTVVTAIFRIEVTNEGNYQDYKQLINIVQEKNSETADSLTMEGTDIGKGSFFAGNNRMKNWYKNFEPALQNYFFDSVTPISSFHIKIMNNGIKETLPDMKTTLKIYVNNKLVEAKTYDVTKYLGINKQIDVYANNLYNSNK